MALGFCPRCRRALAGCLCAVTLWFGAYDMPERSLFRGLGQQIVMEHSGVSVSATYNLALGLKLVRPLAPDEPEPV